MRNNAPAFLDPGPKQIQ